MWLSHDEGTTTGRAPVQLVEQGPRADGVKGILIDSIDCGNPEVCERRWRFFTEKLSFVLLEPDDNPTKVKVVKNKVAPPFAEAEFDILYAKGVSWEGSVLDSAIKHGLIVKRGSWLSFDGEQLGQGHEGARAQLETDPELLQKMIDRITEKAGEA